MTTKEKSIDNTIGFENIQSVISVPCIPLRGIVMFPHDVLHFDVGRTLSVTAIEQAVKQNNVVFLVTQRNAKVENPAKKDLYNVGIIAIVRQVMRLSDDCVRVLAEGVSRAKVKNYFFENGVICAQVEPLKDKKFRGSESYKRMLIKKVHEAFVAFCSFNPKMPENFKETVLDSDDPAYLADYISANLPVDVDDKQYVLEQQSTAKRLETVFDILSRELEICEMDAKIHEKTRRNIEENQKDYYLREQIHVLQEELYGSDDEDNEIETYYKKISESAAPDDVKDILKGEVDKLSKMPPGAHEATVVRVYLDTCLSLPFGKSTKLQLDLKKAEKILNKEHYGLEKVKQQILESIAVFSLKPDTKGRIICLSGPPGVGKTSIAKSLAACMGRNFERVSLGGIHDEAEIRGHRKTYIGSMPGKIIKAVVKAKSTNPLILLDEIDKLGSDYKGDPASAMLEVLDSEQNFSFTDHYLDFPFDLSNVFFVTTANDPGNIPSPLLDRMDVIEISGYTREDKYEIARRHLVKKQMAQNGLSASVFRIESSALYDIIDYYTREAGVRRLERCIASLCRKAAKQIASNSKEKVIITSQTLCNMLGSHKYRTEACLPSDEVGIVNGLAWTSVGGEIMQLEVLDVKGNGKIELTGSLGDVMKESARAAVTWVRANAGRFGIDSDFYKTRDIHIHATEAAIPKDGPSAGVSITTALVSALSNTPICRTVAMTGEITIRGRVLAIGGLKEKTMAAYRAGIKTVIIPKENEPDIEQIDPKVKNALNFVLAENIDDVLSAALCKTDNTGFEVNKIKMSAAQNPKTATPAQL